MDQRVDGSGNAYYDVANIRVTIVKLSHTGSPGVRFQAYKQVGRKGGLLMGAELPVPDKQTAFDLLAAVTVALQAAIDQPV